MIAFMIGFVLGVVATVASYIWWDRIREQMDEFWRRFGR